MTSGTSDGDREIEVRLRRIANPENYHSGRKAGDVLKPENILVFQRREKKDLPLSFMHQHHRCVLITAIQGNGSIGVDTRLHPIRKGQCLMVLPFQTHWYENIDEEGVLWAFVTFEHACDRRLELLRNRGAVDGGDGLYGVLRAWQNEEEADLLGVTLAIWLHHLTRGLQQKKKSRRRVNRPRVDGEWVGSLNRFIFENRAKPLGVNAIASGLGLSSSLLRSKFRRLTGESVGGYVRKLKLQYACELLHDTTLRVGEVAERCGYESLFSFSRAFQNCYRMSPSGYRKVG